VFWLKPAAREGNREPGVIVRSGSAAPALAGNPWQGREKWPLRPDFRGVALSPRLSSGFSAGSASAGWRPGKPRRCAGRSHGSGGLDAAGLSWTSWDMIQKARRLDQARSEATDAGRTERGFHARGNGESAGQRLFRWVGMNGL